MAKKRSQRDSRLWEDEADSGKGFLPFTYSMGFPLRLEFLPSIGRRDVRVDMGLSFRAAILIAGRFGYPAEPKWQEPEHVTPPADHPLVLLFPGEIKTVFSDWAAPLYEKSRSFGPLAEEAARIEVWARAKGDDQHTIAMGPIVQIVRACSLYFDATEGRPLPKERLTLWGKEMVIEANATELIADCAAAVAEASLHLTNMHYGRTYAAAAHWFRRYKGAEGGKQKAENFKTVTQPLKERARAAFCEAKCLNPSISKASWAMQHASGYSVAPRTLRGWLKGF
jgi:hypothetical protein